MQSEVWADLERAEGARLRSLAGELRRARKVGAWDVVERVEIELREAATVKSPPEGGRA